MGRNVTITIWNQTRFDFTDLKKDIEHGKFNREPPTIISKGEMGVFEVGNHTGAKIGAKGNISYSMGNNLRVIITWDHPFSASTSTYTCCSDPLGKIKSTLSPNHPTGHNQSITFSIESI